jgi:VWFA-related protein
MKPPLAAVVLALVIVSHGAARQQPPPQPPTFRTGTNVVRVDVTVIDRRGNPVTALTAEDFEVREDGRPQPITTFKLVEASGLPTDELSLPIRSPEHAAAEAARDDVRVFLVFWDEYHIEEFRSALLARQALERIMLDAFGPTDLVAIMDPLTPTDAVRFSRDRRALADEAHTLKGRRGVYFPRSLVEEEHFRAARGTGGIEILRQQVTTSAIRSAAAFLGTLKEGRKSLVVISETLGPTRSTSEYADVMSDLIRAANDSNTAIFAVDPRGLSAGMGRVSGMLDDIAYASGGQPLLTNDVASRFKRVVVNQASAFYLLGYTKEMPEDGKFHAIKVRVKRSGLEIRARSGYWAPRAKDVASSKIAAAAAVLPPEIETAFASLRPARSRAVAEVWTGVTSDAHGRVQVTVAWTPYSVDDAPPEAAAVSVTATAAGVAVFAGEVDVGGTSFPAPPGPLELILTVRDEKGEILDRLPRTLTVHDPASRSLALTTPVVARARTARDVRAHGTAAHVPVHAGRDFERTDRLLVRLASLGSDAGVTVRASLLNRRGALLVELPVDADATRGGHLIDLPLSNIARGDYVIAVEARRGEERAEAHVPFRIVR